VRFSSKQGLFSKRNGLLFLVGGITTPVNRIDPTPKTFPKRTVVISEYDEVAVEIIRNTLADRWPLQIQLLNMLHRLE
jgi:hypothetical protein